MKTVDDYIKEAWQALLRGDTARRDELCRQAQRMLDLQRRGPDALVAEFAGILVGDKPRPVICLPDRSGETIQ